MSDIRKYIDLVEKNLLEWPFAKKEINIDDRINNRRQPTILPKPVGFMQPPAKPVTNHHGGDSPELETARRFKSAEAYAYDAGVNQYMPINSYDDFATKKRAHDEAEALKRKWNFWKSGGYI